MNRGVEEKIADLHYSIYDAIDTDTIFLMGKGYERPYERSSFKIDTVSSIAGMVYREIYANR